MARIRRHKRVVVTIEKELIYLVDRYSPFSFSKTVEVALKDFLKKHYRINYKLHEEIKYRVSIEKQLREAELEKLKEDLELLTKLSK